jgi:hypothetical protein
MDDINSNEIAPYRPDSTGEIILYQPDHSLKLEVRLEDETVWLSQAQMVELFDTTKQNISLHINNIFKEKELERISTVKDYLTVQQEGGRCVQRSVSYYNLDVIISVGYRIRSQRGTLFRIWATRVIKDYLLRGYAINQRFERIEYRVTETEKKIDFLVNAPLKPREGIFYDGQIFDAYAFVSDLIKSAHTSIFLIDNYVDESVFLLLSKRGKGVDATVYTEKISPRMRLDLQKHNAQYPPVAVKTFARSHDRFLIIDDVVYHFGASLKDLGKKWFAFSKMRLEAQALLQNIR